MDISSIMNYAELFKKDMSLLETSLKGKDRDTLLKIKANYDSLTSVFLKVSQLFNERGFKNHGIEGQMRKSAHILEKALIQTKLLCSPLGNMKRLSYKKG